jgi:ATP-dependent RNA helicase RhlE
MKRVSDEAVLASPFTALGLDAPLVRAVVAEGYDTPTPIQAQAIPVVLEAKDVIGCAQTGTGKTAAFVLPMLQVLGAPQGRIRALILTPTRELASQIGDRIRVYGQDQRLRHALVYGGVSQHGQERQLARSPDVLVATPGRLIDLMEQGIVALQNVELLVLDEADTMLDMGFIHAVRRIVGQVPKQRQTLLFSATMPKSITALANSVLREPVRISVTPQSTAADTVDQTLHFVKRADKRSLLTNLLSQDEVARALVFTRTKHGADRVARQLDQAGIRALAIHGNKSQSAREKALGLFRRGSVPVLVATDVAARGIDVPDVSHVVNYDLPNVAENYVHRIGRTGRAGAKGSAISFCEHDQQQLLADIERAIRQTIPVVGERPEPLPPPPSRGAGGSGGRPRFRGRRMRPRAYAS